MNDHSTLRAPLAERLVRYRDLVPCLNAFVDTRSPGSEAKENFTIIGPGVSENPDQYIHIAEPHGFNIGGARQPPHCVNSQHSHETAEVFVVLNGRWSFNLGETGNDARIILEAGDTISLPTGLFRGFENVGNEVGFLWAVLGGDDPGRVLWAPYVFDMAQEHGLVLLEDGSLIDTVAGGTIPAGKAPMPRTDAAAMAKLRRMSADDIAECVVRRAECDTLPQGPLSMLVGVTETAIIGPANPREGIGAGKMAWSHGFALRYLSLERRAFVYEHERDEPEVLFLRAGDLTVGSGDEVVTMAQGDTLTIPVGRRRTFFSANGAEVYVVHGGDQPAMPKWLL